MGLARTKRPESEATAQPRRDRRAGRNEIDKDVLLALDENIFFSEPHYDGYPAVLVRLPAIDLELLREVLIEAWRCQAPKALARLIR